jgi:hypothetical protein
MVECTVGYRGALGRPLDDGRGPAPVHHHDVVPRQARDVEAGQERDGLRDVGAAREHPRVDRVVVGLPGRVGLQSLHRGHRGQVEEQPLVVEPGERVPLRVVHPEEDTAVLRAAGGLDPQGEAVRAPVLVGRDPGPAAPGHVEDRAAVPGRSGRKGPQEATPQDRNGTPGHSRAGQAGGRRPSTQPIGRESATTRTTLRTSERTSVWAAGPPNRKPCSSGVDRRLPLYRRLRRPGWLAPIPALRGGPGLAGRAGATATHRIPRLRLCPTILAGSRRG